MEDLSEVVQKYINHEKTILIKRMCLNEVSLLNKEKELIEKYVASNENNVCDHVNKKLKISNEFENMDFLSNDSETNVCDNLPIINSELQVENNKNEIVNINDTENLTELDLDALNHKFKNMSLKQIQNICMDKKIEIYKKSKNSDKTVKKTKKELINVLISN
jgi:hypothetical protein